MNGLFNSHTNKQTEKYQSSHFLNTRHNHFDILPDPITHRRSLALRDRLRQHTKVRRGTIICMESINGTIERITYYNDANGYTVLRLMPDQKHLDASRDGTITVVGTMVELAVGENVQFQGAWIEDPRWGKQFRAEIVRQITPNSIKGIKRYLGSGLVKGLGEATAERIVDHFGLETIDILNRTPHRLSEVPGLKASLAQKLAKAWAANQSAREAMIFLQGYGVSSRFALRIHGEYGDDTIQRIKEDPYRLADDIFGIGFVKADAIAQSMGLETNAPGRIRAGLSYALNRLSQDGHTFSPRPLLLDTAIELLKLIDRDRINQILDITLNSGDLIAETVTGSDGRTVEAIYLPIFYHVERKAARNLQNIAATQTSRIGDLSDTHWPTFLAELAEENEISLTSQQQSAVKAALTSKVSVLTGGPGTGKTTTLRMIIQALHSQECTFALASPTGRAAKRLSEATGCPASTIHRLLGFTQDGTFAFDEDAQLDADIFIVDEASMLDLMLFNNLLKAIPPESHLMLVGDIDQLPSVGAGNVLHDVIESDIAHVTRLSAIFRQGAGSMIIENSHRINQGQYPITDNQSSDFYYFGEDDPQKAAELLVDVVKNRLPGRFGFNPMEDIQVIAPMYRGAVGVIALNESLQRELNGDPRMAEKKLAGRLFRVGDKVMQTRNNYDKEVFNGDIGRIYGIDEEDQSLEVVIDNRFVYYEWSEAEELTHAYCISTHRSQGAEYPVIVIPVTTQHYMMLQRNLLYTAITRARKMVVLVGSRRAIHMAVDNNKVAERYSGLLHRLRS